MTAYDQVFKAYLDSKKNNFWDAWGIVASPKIIHELKGECIEQMKLFKTDQGELEILFGLVIIPHNMVEDDKVYIVDEQLGRTILRLMQRSE